ncbi:hypothetical protein [Bifidobacterium scaligerum]|uniref:Uncharacterized protein n=1 Tax=Bifidobacterium scaligerum TaxID=2052656 RepID=A0A2M9HT55_9BIFI|nr:hypothetical protein [Bifidobacterium scaligerum]PJM79991.1 hypothetical protein CUU80_02325 [Bifidobacterium scaligerum]
MSEPKLTENMIATAVTSMLCNACGCQPLEALDTWDRWLVEHDRRIAEQAWADGWEEGQYSAESWYTGDTEASKTAKTLEDNPYFRKEES